MDQIISNLAYRGNILLGNTRTDVIEKQTAQCYVQYVRGYSLNCFVLTRTFTTAAVRVPCGDACKQQIPLIFVQRCGDTSVIRATTVSESEVKKLVDIVIQEQFEGRGYPSAVRIVNDLPESCRTRVECEQTETTVPCFVHGSSLIRTT